MAERASLSESTTLHQELQRKLTILQNHLAAGPEASKELSDVAGDVIGLIDRLDGVRQREEGSRYHGQAFPTSELMVIVFTDLVGATRLKSSMGDEEARKIEEEHRKLLFAALDRSAGGEASKKAQPVRVEGDSYIFLFGSHGDAVLFALWAQKLHREAPIDLPRFRVGIHSGQGLREEGLKGRDIKGLQADLTSRIMSLAEGGQILCSAHVADDAKHSLRGRLPDGSDVEYRSHGGYYLKGRVDSKGRATPLEIHEIGEKGEAPFRKPKGNEKARPALTARQKRLRWAVPLVSLVLLWGFYYTGVLDSRAVGIDGAVESLLYRYAVGTRALLPSGTLALVAADAEVDPSWRPRHAALIHRLSRAGVRVIAFDMSFEGETESDDELEKAIRTAGEKGTDVVVGFRDHRDGTPLISDGVREAVKERDGFLCLRKEDDWITRVPIYIRKRHDWMGDFQSLALRTVAVYEKALVRPDFSYGRREIGVDDRRIAVYTMEPVSGTGTCDAVGAGDLSADILIDLPPVSAFRDSTLRFDYESLVEGPRPPAEALDDLMGKIVIVGETSERERFRVAGREYYGMEIHAAAVDAMLTGRLFRSPLGLVRYGMMALSMLLGVLLFLRRNAAAWRLAGMLLFPVLLVSGALFLAKGYRLLFPPVYELTAFFTGMFLSVHLLPKERSEW